MNSKPTPPRRIAAQLPPQAANNGAQKLPIPEEAKQFLQLIMEQLKPKHKPILNALKELGVSVKMREVGGVQSFIIGVNELMAKEYAFMSGVNMADFDEAATDEA